MAKIKKATLLLPVTRAGIRRMRTGRAMARLRRMDFTAPQWAWIRGHKLPVRPSDWRVEIPSPLREKLEFGQKLKVTYVEYPEEFEQIGKDKKGDMIYYDSDSRTYVAVREPEERPPDEIERQPQLEEDFTYSIECLPPGEPVFTKRGIIPIEKIKGGDRVLTHRGQYQKVTKNYSMPFNGHLIEVRTVGGFHLKSTPNHPFWAIRTKKCVLKHTHKMNVKCYAGCPLAYKGDIGYNKASSWCKKKFYESYKFEWIKAEDLRVGDILAFPIDKGVKPQTLSPSIFRLIGYYLGEGWISKGANRGYLYYRTSFTFNKIETKYINDTLKLLKTFFGFEYKTIPEKNIVRICSNLREMANFFKQFGISSHYKHIPLKFRRASKQHLIELIKGLYYAEGSKGKYENSICVVATVSRQMALEICEILCKLGFPPHLRQYDNMPGSLSKTRAPIYLVDISGHKYIKKFKKMIDMPLNHNIIKKFRNKSWIKGNYLYLPIRKIVKSSYNGTVWSPHVEKDSSFVAGFFATHNTDGNERFEAEITGTIRYAGKDKTDIERIENTIQKEIFDYIKTNFDASKKPESKKLADALIKSGVEYGVTDSPATDTIDITIEKTKERVWTGRFRVRI